MMLLLSGEGLTDIGRCQIAVSLCECGQFQPGPMAVIADQLAEQKCGYSLLDTGAVCFIDEHSLAMYGKSLSIPRSPRLPGNKVERDTGYFRKNAQALGNKAMELEAQRGLPIVSILFRDSDGSNSSTRSLWQDKFNSIVQGFKDIGYDRGVPMVPKPKSEAWLLCALKSNSYQNCAALENESGNDASPNSLKMQLDVAVGSHASAEELSDWVREGRIDPGMIDMPSLDAFKIELNRAMDSALSH